MGARSAEETRQVSDIQHIQVVSSLRAIIAYVTSRVNVDKAIGGIKDQDARNKNTILDGEI